MTHQKHLPHLVHPKYRPDIDGLRAIAILAVIIFHAFPDKMASGFIGVDIFFVISGFLISTIIFSSLERDRFNLVEFYVRRIRRIFPALILVLASCLTFGWFVLFADEYQQLGEHTAAAAGFIQNIILWREIGYFDNLAETKPLLHLWTLAIEEQFYIFWPLLLAFVWKRQWSFLRITAVIAAISFATNIYLMSNHKDAAFFLPLPRFWELMAGGILAYLILHRPRLIDKYKNVQSLFGFSLLFAGLLLLNKSSNFPGWWALLPTLGAFFIISAGSGAWLNDKLLSNRLMVWIGLISYPLYLWHWPILTYLRILFPDPPELIRLAALALAAFLAWLTYIAIELKIRTFGSKAVIPLVGSMILIAVIGELIFFADGVPQRNVNKPFMQFDSKLIEKSHWSDGSCQKLLGLKLVDEEVCLTNSTKPKVLFVGDSHAMALFSAIYAGKYSADGLLISGHSCPTYPNLQYTPTYNKAWGNNCTAIANEVIKASGAISSVDTVVILNNAPRDASPIIFRDSNHSYNESEAFIVGNEFLVRTLLGLGKKVIFVIDAPHLKRNPIECISRGFTVPNQDCAPSRMEHDELLKNYRRSIDSIQKHFPKLIVFDPTAIFCDKKRCWFQDTHGNILYNDLQHISVEASGQMLGEILQNPH